MTLDACATSALFTLRRYHRASRHIGLEQDSICVNRSLIIHIYAVGDATVQSLFKMGIEPHVRVFDLRTQRKPLPVKQIIFFEKLTGRKDAAVNPAGHISPSLEKAIWRALHTTGPTDLFVVGEEDLAVLPLLMQAESGVICYGQPKKGMVVVLVNAETKKKAHELYAQFKTVREKKP